MRQNFPKHERLSSKKWIQELFSKGLSFTAYPFKVVYLPISREQAISIPRPSLSVTEPPPVQVLFSCSKRSFKKAVDRNKVKRRMREAWRLHKPVFVADSYFLIAYIYIAREILPFQLIEGKLKTSIKRLKDIAQSDTST